MAILLATLVLAACNPAPAETKSASYSVPPAGAPVSGLALVSERDGNAEIYVLELATGTLTNLTKHPGKDIVPTWPTDEKSIAFTSDRDGHDDDIFVMDADGSNPRILTQHPGRDFHPAWSPVQ